MALPSIVAGHHVKVYINGTLLGYISGMPQWIIRTDYRQAREIDSNLTKELMPGQYEVGGTFTILRGRSTGGLEGAGMVASAENMLLQKYLTIELVDRGTEEVIFRATECMVTNQTWGTAPKQLVVGSFTWVGISFENEAKR